jgi:two-component system, sporulation sensor kinase A
VALEVARLVRRAGWTVPAAAAIVLLTFSIDVRLPVGVAAGILYIIAVLIGLWATTERFPLFVAAIASVLTLSGFYLSPPGSVVDAYFNRPLILLTVWLTALLVRRHLRVSRQLARGIIGYREGEANLRRSLKDLADLKYALDQSSIVATTDRRGLITFANDKFCEISKYSREELIGRDHRIINSGHHPKEFFRDLWQTIGSGQIWRGEIKNRAKDGTYYWVDTTIVPFLDDHGKPYQYMAIRNDITERKRAEAILFEQAALARLGSMAAVVAHEVKNPLAGLKGALEILRTRVQGVSEQRVIGEMITRIDSLNHLLQDLLVFARPPTPKVQPVRMTAVLNDTILLLTRDPTLSGVQVEIDASADPMVAADPELLKGVFLNLLLNSAQAQGLEGAIHVSVAQHDGSAEVRVADTGPGIAPDVLARIFEPFFTTKHRGTGLGLAIARRTIELHGGRIDVECPPDGGTVMTVELPVSPPASAPRPPEIRG